MLRSKWNRFVLAHRLVRRLREEYNAKSCGFKCYVRVAVPEDDMFSDEYSDAYFVDNGVATYVCNKYKDCEVCDNSECKHFVWNKSYIDLANKLSEAKDRRHRAFLNLVNIRKK